MDAGGVTKSGRPVTRSADPAPNRSRAASGSKAPSAAEIWAQARGNVDIGRPGTGYRLGSRALSRLTRERLPDEVAAALRARILITMADAQVELGQVEQASSLLDTALAASPAALPVVQASRGVLLARTGRLDASREQLDAAISGLAGAGGSRHNLVRALLWRGMLHLSEARLDGATADCETAADLGRATGLDAAVVIATHNLGLVKYVSGDLPGALQEMTRAQELGPQVRAGVRALDRARVLLAAGLLAEAREVAERAERSFSAERSRVELADALLVTAEIDLVAGDASAARLAARRAARTYTAARHARGVFTARVMETRAEGQVRAGLRPPSRRRALAGAEIAGTLARQLTDTGLPEDARAVRLLQAQALLEAGDLAGAEQAAAAASDLGTTEARSGRTGDASGASRRAPRVPLIATELHTRVVNARIELAHGRRSAGLMHIRRGLDDLAAYQARFGSQDLQSASAVHGQELTRLGLRTALQTESPAAILQWLERSRAASTRLAAVRPSADGVLARELSKLRMATYRARMAEMSGEPDRELEDEVDELRRRVRSRSWLVGGSGAVNRPLPLAAVQRRLAEAGSGNGSGKVSIVAPFRGGGRFHALVITASSARYLRLSSDFGLDSALNRIIGDLNILADHRVMAPLRKVAGTSLRAGLNRVAEYIAAPVEPLVDDGPVVVAAAGSAAIVPWALLPGLSGRAISVSPSVTAAVAGMGRTAEEFRHGVLSVAGPEVPHGTEEAQAVADVYSGSLSDGPTELLIGEAASGRAVLDAMPHAGLLHIAAHGHHEPENPLFSGVLLADGLLYGYDVAPNPALPSQVVLSSCDVGRTDDRPGGEPLGLVAALLRSGVTTVVAGTSRISDRVAAAVMTAYHQRLHKGESPAIALAGAIKAVGETEDDPAPFTCFGAGL
jgi:tetratricopeptide (TPR) repeat protein